MCIKKRFSLSEIDRPTINSCEGWKGSGRSRWWMDALKRNAMRNIGNCKYLRKFIRRSLLLGYFQSGLFSFSFFFFFIYHEESFSFFFFYLGYWKSEKINLNSRMLKIRRFPVVYKYWFSDN